MPVQPDWKPENDFGQPPTDWRSVPPRKPAPPAAKSVSPILPPVLPNGQSPIGPPAGIDTDSGGDKVPVAGSPHAPPTRVSGAGSSVSGPLPAPRLSATATATGGAVAPVTAPTPAGGQQGVTSASLQSTLPAAPCGRTGGKTARKTAPQKPRQKLAVAEQRTHCVSVRFSDTELLRLTTDMAAQHKKELAAVLRDAYFKGPRPVVPPVNLDKWRELSRPLANLNQIAMYLNAGVLPEDFRPLLADLSAKIHALRADLLGQKGRQ